VNEPLDEILLVDKPADWTSFDVVAKIRGFYRQQTGNKKVKVGHGGTLDPFATGLLLVLVGKATKRADTLLKLDKTYEFVAKLGETSTTGDPEGDITTHSTQITPSLEQVERVLESFRGVITQIPPKFSAIKVGGKRSYDLARAGKEVRLEPRTVTVYSLELADYTWPELKCVARVSSGTYIRTLAEDIGAALGVGAYCSQLRRTEVGSYHIKDAKSIESLTK
jgi:tRNA pseudouridine55 synthase